MDNNFCILKNDFIFSKNKFYYLATKHKFRDNKSNRKYLSILLEIVYIKSYVKFGSLSVNIPAITYKSIISLIGYPNVNIINHTNLYSNIICYKEIESLDMNTIESPNSGIKYIQKNYFSEELINNMYKDIFKCVEKVRLIEKCKQILE